MSTDKEDRDRAVDAYVAAVEAKLDGQDQASDEPWRAEPWGGSDRLWGVIDSRGWVATRLRKDDAESIVADHNAQTELVKVRQLAAMIHECDCKEETGHDPYCCVHLFSAAPDLLKVALSVVYVAEHSGSNAAFVLRGLADDARAAIALATGAQA